MKFIDFHVDTLMHLLEQQLKGLDKECTLHNNTYHVDFSRLQKSRYTAQFFACYINIEGKCLFSNSHFNDAMYAIEKLHEHVLQSDSVAIAQSYSDYVQNSENKKLSCFISIEDGGIIENDISKLAVLHEKGVRAITLTWNYENCIGYPHSKAGNDFGLKPFGFETIAKMEELGILIDVSHLSDKGFWDVCNNTKRPFLATHSNARSVCDNSRNLDNNMIKALADRGGITGLNFYGYFLQGTETSSVKTMLKHIKHIINVGGEDVLALGSDFDGIDGNLELSGVQDIHMLVSSMEKEDISHRVIEKICYKNAENFFKKTL